MTDDQEGMKSPHEQCQARARADAQARCERADRSAVEGVPVQPFVAAEVERRALDAARELWRASGVLHGAGLGSSQLAKELSAMGDRAKALAGGLAVRLYAGS